MKPLALNFGLLCLCLVTPGRVSAQNELTNRNVPNLLDTVSVKAADVIKSQQTVPTDLSGLAAPKPKYEPLELPSPSLDAPSLNVPHLMLREPAYTPGSAVIAGWQGGSFTAAGQINNMPGLMDVASGQLGISQQYGNLTLYFGGVANKYGYFGGLHTQYGLEANASYSLSPRWSLNARGAYYLGNSLPTMTGGMVAPPPIMGYYQSTQLRLTANYQVNSWLGVETGAKVERLFGTDRYRTSPVVTPYFSFGSGNRKVTVGIPVGEIVYELLRSYTGGSGNNNGNGFHFRTTPPGPLLR